MLGSRKSEHSLFETHDPRLKPIRSDSNGWGDTYKTKYKFKAVMPTKVCIIGMGLIGGSLGMALKKNHADVVVYGVVRQKKNINKILSLRAADQVSDDLKEGVKNSHWVILSTPPASFDAILKKISPHLKPNQIVTDVGSVKKTVMLLYQKYLGKNVPYIGSHPIAGSEQKGIEAASVDLFQYAKCIITPDQNTSDQTLKSSMKFWNGLGSSVIVKSADEHDKIFAYVSHLPHLISFSLLKSLAGKGEYMDLSGEAWKDMTRVAHSPSDLWAEILIDNRGNITEALEKFLSGVEDMKKCFKTGKVEAVKKFVLHAQKVLKNGKA